MAHHPICGDPNRIRTYYQCRQNTRCYQTDRAQARYRIRIDTITGDVCEEVAITCPC